MQFDWFLSVLEQKRLENHEIYYIGTAEEHLRFTHCAPLLGWRYFYLKPNVLKSQDWLDSTPSALYFVFLFLWCFIGKNDRFAKTNCVYYVLYSLEVGMYDLFSFSSVICQNLCIRSLSESMAVGRSENLRAIRRK